MNTGSLFGHIHKNNVDNIKQETMEYVITLNSVECQPNQTDILYRQ